MQRRQVVTHRTRQFILHLARKCLEWLVHTIIDGEESTILLSHLTSTIGICKHTSAPSKCTCNASTCTPPKYYIDQHSPSDAHPNPSMQLVFPASQPPQPPLHLPTYEPFPTT
ncbi:hypothetical protein IQ06DRAFT_152215 [Phaeosphaeriaceae sp. SRC1lsM3a]|nr:hypothetical protein IQ06DRAFT_152215 [Stagonospora sp. SRC1lsM3a]